MDIKTPQDWWTCLNKASNGIEQCFVNVYDSVEALKLIAQFQEATVKNDHVSAATMLQSLWNDAPDSIVIHSWPNWQDVCDLCSEYWVFDPSQQ